jgi:diguanylate cyclase (GGDEF)-like protein
MRTAVGAAMVATVIPIFVRELNVLGIVNSLLVVCALGGAASYLLWRRAHATAWLAAGLTVRAVLAALEGVAHASRIAVDRVTPSNTVFSDFLGMSSAFDAGAEWLIVLGCVLALYGTIQLELTTSNADLSRAKEELRALSNRDPLTGVSNRRRLSDIMLESRETGATVLFFDLNDFKDINDAHGHHVGDAALQRFARALQHSFRPGDHVVRYAGDEFIVVGQGLALVDVPERVASVRDFLHDGQVEDGPRIEFAVGAAYLAAGGDPDAAIRAADAAMYRRKDARTDERKDVRTDARTDERTDARTDEHARVG